MTREEAIANLNMISVAFVEPVTKEQRKLIDDTFETAIKALEQNESAEKWYKLFVEKFDACIIDAVSRQAVLDNSWELEYPDGTSERVVSVKDIEQLSSVNPQPCDDAISREAVLSKIKEVCFSEEWTQFRLDNGSNGQRDFLINYIEQLPPVTRYL